MHFHTTPVSSLIYGVNVFVGLPRTACVSVMVTLNQATMAAGLKFASTEHRRDHRWECEHRGFNAAATATSIYSASVSYCKGRATEAYDRRKLDGRALRLARALLTAVVSLEPPSPGRPHPHARSLEPRLLGPRSHEPHLHARAHSGRARSPTHSLELDRRRHLVTESRDGRRLELGRGRLLGGRGRR